MYRKPLHLAGPAVLGLIAILGLLTPGAQAADWEVVTSNDLLAGNPFDDDLYTASFELDLIAGGRRVGLEERMFTDRRRGVRFDETQMLVSLPTHTAGRWNVFTRVGAVHVGRGLLGQDVQNLVHRAIGDEETFLAYPDDRSRLHALAELAVERPAALRLPGGVLFAPALEVSVAPEFKSHAEAGVKTRWRMNRAWTVHADAGYRVTRTDLAALEPRIQGGGTTYRLSVGWRDRVHLTWSRNRYGTGSRHLAIHLRIR